MKIEWHDHLLIPDAEIHYTCQKLIDSTFVYTTDIIQNQKFNGEWQWCVCVYLCVSIQNMSQVYICMYIMLKAHFFCDGILHWLNPICNDMEYANTPLLLETVFVQQNTRKKSTACNFDFSLLTQFKQDELEVKIRGNLFLFGHPSTGYHPSQSLLIYSVSTQCSDLMTP